MRLVDSVCILMAELVYNLCYPVVVLRLECISDEALELECAALALVIELVVQRFGDVDVHVEGRADGLYMLQCRLLHAV